MGISCWISNFKRRDSFSMEPPIEKSKGQSAGKQNGTGSPFREISWGVVRTYPGPPLPRISVAIVKAKMISWQYTAYIESVDGKPLEGSFKAEVLPGKHTVVIGAIFIRSLGGKMISETVSLDARAGHVYHVRAKVKNTKMFLWMEDKETKKVVGGGKP